MPGEEGQTRVSREPPWICPECGKSCGDRRVLVRVRRRPVLAIMGALGLVIGLGILLRGPLAPIWPRYVPRIVLFVASRQLGVNTAHVEPEIERRMWEGDGIVRISRWPTLSRLERRAARIDQFRPGVLYGLDPAGYPTHHFADAGSLVPPDPIAVMMSPAELVDRYNAGETDHLRKLRGLPMLSDAPKSWPSRGPGYSILMNPPIDLDGDGLDDAIVLVEQPLNPMAILSFYRRDDGWVYAGEKQAPTLYSALSSNNKRVAWIGGRPFLILEDNFLVGTGVFTGRLVFYDMSHADGPSVFALPSRGHLYGWAQAIDHEWTVELILDEDSETDLPAAFSAAYRVEYVKSDIDPPPPVSWRVRYAWDDATGRFRATGWEWTCMPKPRYAGETPPMIGGSPDAARFERFHAERR